MQGGCQAAHNVRHLWCLQCLMSEFTRRPNTLSGSRKNIEAHYDAGNDMYKLFLDESMTYSCGIYHAPGKQLFLMLLKVLTCCGCGPSDKAAAPRRLTAWGA